MAYPNEEAPAAPAEEPEEEGDSGESFLAPKSAFYGKDLSPGSEETVRVKAVYEDEVELECVKGGDAESASEDASEPMGAETLEADA